MNNSFACKQNQFLNYDFKFVAVESSYLAHFVILRTSFIKRASQFCLNLNFHSVSGAQNLIKGKVSGAKCLLMQLSVQLVHA